MYFYKNLNEVTQLIKLQARNNHKYLDITFNWTKLEKKGFVLSQ